MSKNAARRLRSASPRIGFDAVISLYGTLEDFPELAWTRKTDCIWEEIETPPGSGTYDWTEMDAAYQEAQAGGYGIVFVLKTGNASGVVDDACYDAVVASHQSVYTRLYSCPIVSAYETAWKNFVRAVIRRFGFGTTEIAVQIETYSGDRQRWNYDLETEGEQAADNYITALRLAYEAKTAEGWTGDIILTGLIEMDRVQICTITPDGESCQTPGEQRNRSLTARLMQYPDYFDAIDFHYLGYTYFMPYSLPMAVAWLRAEAKKNDWNLEDKKLFVLEWVPSFLTNLTQANAVPAVPQYFPYEQDFVAAPYLGDPIAYSYDVEGNVVQVPDGEEPCSFSGDYTGIDDRVFAIAVDQAGVDASPQQFYYTDDYQFDGPAGGQTTWSGPEDITLDPFLIGDGIYVTFNPSGRLVVRPARINEPVACGVQAHTQGAPDSEAIFAAIHLYANLDRAELPPPDGTNADPKYRMWFEQEEAICFIKDLCIMWSLGVERTIHTNFSNYFPEITGPTDLNFRWHGMVRFYDYLLETPTFIKKPSWYCLQMLVDHVLGFAKCEGYHFDDGVVGYKFTFPEEDERDPVYIAWALVSGVPNYRYSATPETLQVKQVDLAFAEILGEEFAYCYTIVTALDEDDQPVAPVTLLEGSATIEVGLMPMIVVPFSVVEPDPGPEPGDDSFLLQDNFVGGIAEWWTSYALGNYDQSPRETPDSSESLSFVDAAWGGGAKAAQFTLVADDYVYRGDRLSDKERAELIWTPTPTAVQIGDLAYYEWSVYIPTDYIWNSDTAPAGSFQIMGQWHDNGAGLGYEPPVAVRYFQTTGGQSSFRFFYGLNEIGETRQQFTHNINRGQKYVLRFHFLWSNADDGSLGVYVDDVLVHTFTGKNVYPSQGENPNVFRWGIYRGQVQTQTNVFQMGELSISSDPL